MEQSGFCNRMEPTGYAHREKFTVRTGRVITKAEKSHNLPTVTGRPRIAGGLNPKARELRGSGAEDRCPSPRRHQAGRNGSFHPLFMPPTGSTHPGEGKRVPEATGSDADLTQTSSRTRPETGFNQTPGHPATRSGRSIILAIIVRLEKIDWFPVRIFSLELKVESPDRT